MTKGRFAYVLAVQPARFAWDRRLRLSLTAGTLAFVLGAFIFARIAADVATMG